MDRICDHGASLEATPYLLFNNLWGAATGHGSQCSWLVRGPERRAVEAVPTLAWGTSWDWQGDPDTVKSYVSCVLGWHWGWPVPGGPLPIRLEDLASARSEWAFRLEADDGGRLNVTYDVWLAGSPDPAQGDPTDEVMVWLHREGGATPIGQLQATVDVEGAAWELWRGPHPERGWTVHSLVRTERTDFARLDLARFFDVLSPAVPRSAYLVGIEAGTEIFFGRGSLETARFSVDIEPR
jgi:xyloglucan-specific endo-beta-1,4-glucanase